MAAPLAAGGALPAGPGFVGADFAGAGLAPGLPAPGLVMPVRGAPAAGFFDGVGSFVLGMKAIPCPGACYAIGEHRACVLLAPADLLVAPRPVLVVVVFVLLVLVLVFVLLIFLVLFFLLIGAAL